MEKAVVRLNNRRQGQQQKRQRTTANSASCFLLGLVPFPPMLSQALTEETSLNLPIVFLPLIDTRRL